MIDNAEKITSISFLVGTGACNARCKHCAGVMHRTGAPRKDGTIDHELITTILRRCYTKGARSLSISSSGEPTVSPRSVTKVLEIADALRKEGVVYSSIHLYSNGIRIGESEEFAQHYLPLWRSRGLHSLYITVHDVNPIKNAENYGVKNYPNLATIVDRIHAAGLAVRANIVLTKDGICTPATFTSMVAALQRLGFDAVSAWPIRDGDDRIDRSRAPDNIQLEKMAAWAAAETTLGIPVKVLLEKSHAVYEAGLKVTLFPNGILSNKWCA